MNDNDDEQREMELAATGYLRFENENPANDDIYFDSVEEACAYVYARDWRLESQMFTPYGFVEEHIRVYRSAFAGREYVGELIRMKRNAR